jgi:ADP-heptose:LPS heptosyltransferase
LQVKFSLSRKSFSFDKINLEKWLIVNFGFNRLPDQHIVDRYFETVKSLNVQNDGEGLDFFIRKEDEINIQQLPVSHQQGYVGIAIGAKHNTKILPQDKLIKLCKALEQPIILLGGKEDAIRGEQIAAETGRSIYNACGKFNLGQSASLVKQASVIITHDTGLMHIAAAFKKRIISIWGNTVPEFGMYPYLPESFQEGSAIIEVNGLSCRPCSKIGYEKCPLGHFNCMNKNDLEEITQIVKSMQRSIIHN